MKTYCCPLTNHREKREEGGLNRQKGREKSNSQRQHDGWRRPMREERVKVLFKVERMANLQRQIARMTAQHMKCLPETDGIIRSIFHHF